MTPSAFINCLFRFISRRPGVKRAYSDCGTNFTAADKELRNEISQWNESVNLELRKKGIVWHFNPPASPHRSGLVERAVQSVKRVLKKIVNDCSGLSDDLLHTFSTAVEGILNQRPLTRASDDARDLQALCPAMLVSPGTPFFNTSSVIPPNKDCDGNLLRRQWRYGRNMVATFWKRWTQEYISGLQERQKWFEPSRNLEVGDLVLLLQDQRSRGEWPLAVVTAAFPGPDGLVRSVRVRTAVREFDRDRSKVVLLEADVGGNSVDNPTPPPSPANPPPPLEVSNSIPLMETPIKDVNSKTMKRPLMLRRLQ